MHFELVIRLISLRRGSVILVFSIAQLTGFKNIIHNTIEPNLECFFSALAYIFGDRIK